MEEFEEADVLWPDDHDRPAAATLSSSPRESNCARRRESDPVDIPPRTSRSWTLGFTYRGSDEEEEGGGCGEIVPPHVLVSRSGMSEKMAFSVCTGNGRTLKGRDLSHVRNYVLRMTGFLER